MWNDKPAPHKPVYPEQVLQHANIYPDLGRSGLDLPWSPPVDPEQVLQHVQVRSPVNEQLTALSVAGDAAFPLVDHILQAQKKQNPRIRVRTRPTFLDSYLPAAGTRAETAHVPDLPCHARSMEV